MRGLSWYALLVLVAGSSYGFVSSVMKVGYDHGFTVQQVTDGQYIVAVVALWLLAFLLPKKKPIAKSQWWLLLVLGLAGAGTSYTYYIALTLLPASLAIVLLFQFSWMVLVFDIVATRRWPSLQKWLGVLLIAVGTVLAVGLFQQSLGDFPLWAIGMGLMSAFCYALTLYLSGYVGTESSPTMRAAITATVSLVAIFVVFPPTHVWSAHVWSGLWPWAVLTGLLSQVIPLCLMLIAIPHTGGRMAGILGAIELPVAVLVARVMLSEPVSAWRWVGVALILIGIVASEWVIQTKSMKLQRKTI